MSEKKSKYENEWMRRLTDNLLILETHEPKGVAKLVLHDARETILFLLSEMANLESPTLKDEGEEG